ncbi:helix-turn-helix domain-containing protein [Agrococcus sp. DT81.2]|uniref:helix-turn-helix domain-containing protein n=1 Tax=Agrococcus sp. DT81.2 TaxID=3393414 RepID=UPI003CE5A654
MTTNHDTVAGRVVAAMTAGEWSIKGTAEAAGIPATTFRRKIAGHADFTVTEIGRIATALNIAPADLLPTRFKSAA